MTTAEESKRLVLTRWGAVAAGFASVVGASMIALPPAILSETGSAAVATWLVAVALCVPMIMLFRDTVLLTPGSADPLRDTVRAGLGQSWGNLIPIMFGMVVIVGLPTNAVVAGRNLAQAAGAEIPGVAVASCVLVLAVTVNLVGGGAGAWLQRAGAIALVAVLMAVMFWSFAHAQQSPVALPQVDAIPMIPAGVILAFWAFVGFENLTFLAGDMADPPRDFAVVAAITLVLLTVLSIALTLAVAVQIPPGAVDPVTGLVDAALRLPGGRFAGALLATAGFVGVLINAITWVRGVSLILTAAARDHLVPAWIAGPDPLQPRRAVAVMAAGFVLVLLALHGMPDLVVAALAAASAVFVVIYLICITAYLRTRGPWRWRLANLALAPVLLWSLWDAGARSLYAVVVLVVAATVAIRARRRAYQGRTVRREISHRCSWSRSDVGRKQPQTGICAGGNKCQGPVARQQRQSCAPVGLRHCVAAVAVTWAVGFALLHAAWAAGSRLLLDDAVAADVAFGRLWFRIYNAFVVAGSLCAAAAVIASSRARAAAVRRWARRTLWAVSVLLLVRGGIGAAQFGNALASADRGLPPEAWLIDLFMLFGGVVFCATARALRTTTQPPDARSTPASARPALVIASGTTTTTAPDQAADEEGVR